jgi:hypothetical protein
MSLDFYLEEMQPVAVFDANITHNLNTMADEAGIYQALWRPEEIGATVGRDLIPVLQAGLARLVAHPKRFKAFNPENGWGSYAGLVKFARSVLAACEDNPDATIRVSR